MARTRTPAAPPSPGPAQLADQIETLRETIADLASVIAQLDSTVTYLTKNLRADQYRPA